MTQIWARILRSYFCATPKTETVYHGLTENLHHIKGKRLTTIANSVVEADERVEALRRQKACYLVG